MSDLEEQRGRGMSELREKIAGVVGSVAREAIADYRNYGYDHAVGDPDDDERREENLDRILALIAEALLSPEAVEAGAQSFSEYDDPEEVARNIITAALEAAGIGADDAS